VPAALLAFAQGREHARSENQYDEAVEAVTKAYKLMPSLQPTEAEPDLSKAFRSRAEFAYPEQGFDVALEYLDRALELDPASKVEVAKVWRDIGWRHAQECQFEEALAAFEQADEVDSSPVHNPDEELRKALMERSREPGDSFQTSVPEAQEAIAMGRVCAVQGDSEQEQALAAFTLAVELDPELKLVPKAEVALLRGQEFYRQGALDKAVDALQDAVEFSPNLPLAEPEMADAIRSFTNTAFSAGKDYNTVLKSLRLAAKLDPAGQSEIAQLCINFGKQYYQQGQTEEGDAALRLANELDPSLQLLPKNE
jgi:tetratricopeptide (TPR) repeat protein